MPGYLMQCYDNVGGTDLWLGSWYSPSAKWWTGWHTPTAFHHWPGLRRTPKWQLIGYEQWSDDGWPTRIIQAYRAFPNPSTVTKGSDLTPQGHWRHAYSADGSVTHATYHTDILTWAVKEEFIKGQGKGTPEGKGKGTSKGKGKGAPKGQGKGNAKGKRTKGKGNAKGKSNGEQQDI